MAYSYGTAKSGVGISAMSVLRPDLMMKCSVPVVMAGIIAVRQGSRIPVPPHLILSALFLIRSTVSSYRCSFLETVRITRALYNVLVD